MKFVAAAFAIATVLFAGQVAHAQTTVSSTRSGWVTSGGAINSDSGNNNTFTGVVGGQDYRSFIEFPVPASVTAYTSAVLRLNIGAVRNGPNDLSIYDSAGIIPGGGVTFYSDLGSGVLFGSQAGLNTDGQVVEITLDPAGIAAVNAARGGPLVLGFVSSPTTADPDGLFAVTGPATLRQLVLVPTAAAPVIPTLTEWAMILFGMGLAGGAAVYLNRWRQLA